MTRFSILRWFLSNLILAAILFGCGGLARSWARIGYLVIFGMAGLITALVTDPTLALERSRPGPGALDTSGRLLTSVLFVFTVAAAAFDGGRLHYPASIPREFQVGALILLIPLEGLQIWAMTVNPFFSSVIRLQTDRGHRLVARGPYRFIRHPGYLAMLLTMPVTAIALGSWVALFPALFYSAVILRRTIQEDRFLKENLDGYTQYAADVRYRLAPELW